MATNDAPTDPLTTTEITAAPTVPLSAGQAAAPAPNPASAPSPTPAPAQRGAPEPVTDHGDPDMPGETKEQATGVGSEGETTVWEARYSMKNFLGRLILLGIFTVAWIALAVFAWGYDHPQGTAWPILAIAAGIALGLFWLALLRRIILARYGHYYRLSNRRVFVSTGLFNRRRDQMELLRINDVYTKQSLSQRWLSIGTVVVVSSEPQFPIIYLTGVDDPKYVMDLVWHHARAERDRRSVKVDQI